MTFGERLKQIRKELGLSYVEFAKRCEIAERSVRWYEDDEYLPRFDTLLLIAKGSKMTLSELLEGVRYD